jgi:hypothetical protein
VFNLADWYTSGAMDGARGMQGEHPLACFRSPEIFAHWRRSQQLRPQNLAHEARSRLHFGGDGAAYSVEVEKWKWGLMLVVVIAGFVGLPYKTLLHL